MSWIGNIIRSVFNNEGIGGVKNNDIVDKHSPLDKKKKLAEPAESLKKVKEAAIDLKSMTKRQLEEYGRTLGIELDRRHNKKSLIKKLEEVA
jgi:hypothetical protein